MKYGYLIVSAFLLAAGSGIGGCGTTNSGHGDVALHMTPDDYGPQPHIGKYARGIDRADFDPDGIDWEVDNAEGLRMHLGEVYLYLDFTYTQPAPNIQFFIDTDNDPKSGNIDEGGAEYMVENGYLYRSTDPKKWRWQEIGEVEHVSKTDLRYTLRIKRSQLPDLAILFGVNAQALDSKWHPVVMSPLDGSKTLYTTQDVIDWSSITPYAATGEKTVKLFDTDKMLYVHLEQKSRTEHIQIYIDSDNNPESGYTNSSWEAFGRDYLVEDGMLYHYTGSGAWGWEEVASVDRRRSDQGKDILDIAIPKAKLSLAPTIKIGVETNNKKWKDTVFVPEGAISPYLLQGSMHSATVQISEVMAANTHTKLDPDYFNFSDWIELYNPSESVVDIGGYAISDKLNDPKWTFPAGTTIAPHGYLLVWADEKDKAGNGLHTNFKLKMDGEAVALFGKEGKMIEGFAYLKQHPDISVAMENGQLSYMPPSPGSQNAAGVPTLILSQKPAFSLAEGLYANPQSVTIAASAGEQIYYTTDGSIPTADSAVYTGAIDISHSLTLRAIGLEEGKFASEVATATYLIGEDSDIPVVSIAIDDKYLNDERIGIYTEGTNGKVIPDCGEENPVKANYNQKWERPAHMTLFENNHTAVLSQDIGLKISGECSRSNPQKSFQLKADDKYGKGKFKYQVFRDKTIDSFERLKLRNAGQDFIKTHMRDALAQMVAKEQPNILYEAYRPTLVFINGEFWGLYSLREKLGEEYLEENFDAKKANLLEDDRIVKEGSSEDYDALVEFLGNHSLVSQENYDYVASKIDIDNYIDYMITNIYAGNADWPGTNLVYWKPKSGGKWQWILHDMDFGFALYADWGVDYDTLAAATAVNGPEWPNPAWSTLLLRRLLENPGFKATFKNRLTARLDTVFAPASVKRVIDRMSAEVSPYIQRHIDRWKIDGQYSYAVNSKADWEAEVQKLRDFADRRPELVKAHLQRDLP